MKNQFKEFWKDINSPQAKGNIVVTEDNIDAIKARLLETLSRQYPNKNIKIGSTISGKDKSGNNLFRLTVEVT